MYKLCKTEESTSRQKLLEDGLLQAMKSQPFEDISVSDLCKQLGIPRNTFDRYFSDKEGALLALMDHTLTECNRNSFSKWKGSSKVERSDLETFFTYWNAKRDFIDAIAKNGLLWMLIDRCNFLLDQRRKNTHSTGDLTNFAKEGLYLPLRHDDHSVPMVALWFFGNATGNGECYLQNVRFFRHCVNGLVFVMCTKKEYLFLGRCATPRVCLYLPNKFCIQYNY